MQAFAISVVLMSGACGNASTAASHDVQLPRPVIVCHQSSPASTTSVRLPRYLFRDANSSGKREMR